MHSKRRLSSPKAMAVMVRIGGWEEEEGEEHHWVGPRFAASMWIYTKVVICNGQNHMQNNRIFKLRSIMEAVNWVSDDALDEHVWLSEHAISLQEAKVFGSLARRPRNSMRRPVEDVMFLGTNKPTMIF